MKALSSLGKEVVVGQAPSDEEGAGRSPYRSSCLVLAELSTRA